MGRKLLGKARVQIKIIPAALEKLNDRAKKMKINRSEVIEQMVLGKRKK